MKRVGGSSQLILLKTLGFYSLEHLSSVQQPIFFMPLVKHFPTMSLHAQSQPQPLSLLVVPTMFFHSARPNLTDDLFLSTL